MEENTIKLHVYACWSTSLKGYDSKPVSSLSGKDLKPHEQRNKEVAIAGHYFRIAMLCNYKTISDARLLVCCRIVLAASYAYHRRATEQYWFGSRASCASG